MLFPRSYAWTLRQRWFIAAAVVAGLVAFSALIYIYERYYRGPDDSFFVGTWRGHYEPTTLYWGPSERSFHFKPDHTCEEGQWYAAGEFLYLRQRLDAGGNPYDRLDVWHIDWMSADEVRISQFGGHITLKRGE